MRWMAACDDVRRSLAGTSRCEVPIEVRRSLYAGGGSSPGIYDGGDDGGDGDDDDDDDGGDDDEMWGGDVWGAADGVDGDANDGRSGPALSGPALSGSGTASRRLGKASARAADDPPVQWSLACVVGQIAVGVYRAARRNIPRSAIAWGG
ncbi:MAG: hypothetical protein COY86_00885, partial [Rhodobacterales bacterium CG_4_10_14_0_8_um_filter_70_9]